MATQRGYFQINISGSTSPSDVASSLMTPDAVWGHSYLTRADVMESGHIIAPFITNAAVTSLSTHVSKKILDANSDAGPVITVLGLVESYHGDGNASKPNDGHE